MTHTCHAIGCKSECNPGHLMCRIHWERLPWPRRDSVEREYVVGQCNNDPTPTPQWHDAADAAIYWIHIADLKKRIRDLNKKII